MGLRSEGGLVCMYGLDMNGHGLITLLMMDITGR
jgi:hypothetical protein